MKPFIHANSSYKKFGGDLSQHLAIHERLDSSKAGMPDVRHRSIFHHEIGCAIMQKIFKDIDSKFVTKIVLRHIKEDLSFLPSVLNYAAELQIPARMKQKTTTEEQIACSIKIYGGSSEDYRDIHTVMDRPLILLEKKQQSLWNKFLRPKLIDSERLTYLLHHAFGTFTIENIFGQVIKNADGVQVSVRQLAEEHCMNDFDGWIPTLQEWLENMKVQNWMIRPAVLKGEKKKVYIQPKIVIKKEVHHHHHKVDWSRRKID